MGRYLVEKAYNNKKYGNLMETMAIVGCFLINFSVVVGGIVESSAVFSEGLGISQFICKLGAVALLAIVTALVLEPERLKPLGILTAIIYTTICKKAF